MKKSLALLLVFALVLLPACAAKEEAPPPAEEQPEVVAPEPEPEVVTPEPEAQTESTKSPADEIITEANAILGQAGKSMTIPQSEWISGVNDYGIEEIEHALASIGSEVEIRFYPSEYKQPDSPVSEISITLNVVTENNISAVATLASGIISAVDPSLTWEEAMYIVADLFVQDAVVPLYTSETGFTYQLMISSSGDNLDISILFPL